MLHGIPLAINAGDGLLLLSLRPLLDNMENIGTHLALRILQETEKMAWEAAEGQAMELGWRRDNSTDLSDSDYLVMVLKKTCWLGVIYPSRVGALIGSRGNVSLEQFVRFGFFLGAAFQIQDDLLNFVADERYGKELERRHFRGQAYADADPLPSAVRRRGADAPLSHAGPAEARAVCGRDRVGARPDGDIRLGGLRPERCTRARRRRPARVLGHLQRFAGFGRQGFHRRPYHMGI